MKRRGLLVGLPLAAALAALALWFAISRFSLSALSEPGRVETYVATQGKHWLVARDARGPLPAEPAKTDTSAAIGNMQFGGRCASCHGIDGRTPTDVGRWMYPRAPDLGSPEVQQWSDAELFWIIKHGIRLSGMPGFGNNLSDEQTWHVVHYVRRVGAEPKK